MSEEPVLIRRIEMYFDEERKPVKKIQDASFKYVTLYDEEGELTEQYQVEIVDGIDPELEEEATEEFREEEHPREEHGKFTDKGMGSQLGDLSQTKTIRDRTFGRTVENHKKRIETISKDLEEYKESLKKEPDNTLRYRGLNSSVGRAEDRLKKAKQDLESFKHRRDEFNKLDLFEIGVGKNSHRRGFKEFKNGVSKNIITKSGWRLDQPRDYINVKGSGYRVLESEFDNAIKGKTIIDSNIPPNADPKILKLGEEIKYVWNDILSDQERDTVDILRIKYTDEPKYKGRGSNKIRTLGTHGGRSAFDSDEGRILISPSVLTVHLAYNDKRGDVLNTVAHELAHARWATEVEPNKEKMTKFTDKIVKMGKENALTEYAGSYFDDLEEVKKENEVKWEERVDHIKHHTYGKAEHQTEEEYQNWLNTNILSDLTNTFKSHTDNSENIKKAEMLIANETHSN